MKGKKKKRKEGKGGVKEGRERKKQNVAIIFHSLPCTNVPYTKIHM